jgi:hypothetical protein
MNVGVGFIVKINGIRPFVWSVLSSDVVNRYQRKQYASIDIVLTERKGFGLRAAADLPKCVSAVFFYLSSLNWYSGTRSFMSTSAM